MAELNLRKDSAVMDQPRKTILLVLLALALAVQVDCTGNRTISAHVGDNVTLPCEATGGVDFEADIVEWNRTDLDPHQCVLFYREGRPYADDQHPSYKDRVNLVQSQLMGGDLSVVLKNVTTNDSGTFECRLIQKSMYVKRRKRSRSRSNPKPISTIVLKVSDPGSTGNTKQTEDDGGHEDRQRLGLIVGSVVVVVVAVVLLSVGLWVFCCP